MRSHSFRRTTMSFRPHVHRSRTEFFQQSRQTAFKHFRDPVRHVFKRRLFDVRSTGKRSQRNAVAEMIDKYLGDEIIGESEVRHHAGHF